MTLKLIYEPTVYLVSLPTIDPDGLFDFLKDHGCETWSSDAESPGDMLPEIGGRLCFMSYKSPRPGGNKAYLEHIKVVGHTSVFEHTNLGFIITGVSRSLTHELVRHRIGLSPSQLSQRYVDESDTSFVVPPEMIEGLREAEKISKGSYIYPNYHLMDDSPPDDGFSWCQSCQLSLWVYQKLVRSMLCRLRIPGPYTTEERKAARQAARSVLPNCTETKIMVTGNARAWRHFLELRGTRHADKEIQRLAFVLLEKLQGVAPALFSDYSIVTDEDGVCEIKTLTPGI